MADTSVVADVLHDPLRATIDEEKGEMDVKLGLDMDEKREDSTTNGREHGEDASSNAHGGLEQHANEDVLAVEAAKDVDHAHDDGEENQPSDIAHETPLSTEPHPQPAEGMDHPPSATQEDLDPYGVHAIAKEANGEPTDEVRPRLWISTEHGVSLINYVHVFLTDLILFLPVFSHITLTCDIYPWYRLSALNTRQRRSRHTRLCSRT